MIIEEYVKDLKVVAATGDVKKVIAILDKWKAYGLLDPDMVAWYKALPDAEQLRALGSLRRRLGV